MSQPRWRLWVILLLLAWVLAGAGPASAQRRGYITQDMEEKPVEGSKPPGKVEPGPQGGSQHGWGQIQKTPGAKGSRSQGLKAEPTQGHSAPSKPRSASVGAPKTPKTPKSPKVPAQPSTAKSSLGVSPEPADQAGRKKDFPGSPQRPDASRIWLQEEGQDLGEDLSLAEDSPEDVSDDDEQRVPAPRKRGWRKTADPW